MERVSERSSRKMDDWPMIRGGCISVCKDARRLVRLTFSSETPDESCSFSASLPLSPNPRNGHGNGKGSRLGMDRSDWREDGMDDG